jgi:DNA topoisomerase-2
LVPWYHNFKGTVALGEKKVITSGVFTKDFKHPNQIVVSEIPIGKRMVSINKYLQTLEKLEDEEKISKLSSQSSANDVKFSFIISDKFEASHESLGLIDSTHMTSMVLFDTKGVLRKFETIEEILEEWCAFRLNFYEIRKKGELKRLQHDISVVKSKISFIQMVLEGAVELRGMSEDDLYTFFKSKKMYENGDSASKSEYDYLLTIQVRHMTKDRVKELQKTLENLLREEETLQKTPVADIWCNELDAFIQVYSKWLKA